MRIYILEKINCVITRCGAGLIVLLCVTYKFLVLATENWLKLVHSLFAEVITKLKPGYRFLDHSICRPTETIERFLQSISYNFITYFAYENGKIMAIRNISAAKNSPECVCGRSRLGKGCPLPIPTSRTPSVSLDGASTLPRY